MRLLFSFVLCLKNMSSWKLTVLLMRAGIGRNPGLTGTRELQVQLAVQYTVTFCATAHSRLSIQPLLPQAVFGLMLPEVSQVKTKNHLSNQLSCLWCGVIWSHDLHPIRFSVCNANPAVLNRFKLTQGSFWIYKILGITAHLVDIWETMRKHLFQLDQAIPDNANLKATVD